MSRVDSGANWDLPFYGFLADFRCPKVSKGRAESPLVRPLAHTPCHGDQRADSGADGGAAAPKGAVLSFEAKDSTKESTRHGCYGKKASIAHFAGGARYVARALIGKISLAIVRAPNSPFSADKMGGPFSLRCLSPLCSAAAWVGAGLKLRELGYFIDTWLLL